MAGPAPTGDANPSVTRSSSPSSVIRVAGVVVPSRSSSALDTSSSAALHTISGTASVTSTSIDTCPPKVAAARSGTRVNR